MHAHMATTVITIMNSHLLKEGAMKKCLALLIAVGFVFVALPTAVTQEMPNTAKRSLVPL